MYPYCTICGESWVDKKCVCNEHVKTHVERLETRLNIEERVVERMRSAIKRVLQDNPLQYNSEDKTYTVSAKLILDLWESGEFVSSLKSNIALECATSSLVKWAFSIFKERKISFEEKIRELEKSVVHYSKICGWYSETGLNKFDYTAEDVIKEAKSCST